MSDSTAARAIDTLRNVFATNSLRDRLARGVLWSFVGGGVSQGSILAASVITARLLGKERFGEFGVIQSTAGMFGIFAGLGLGLTATKYVAEFRSTDPERAGRIIGLSLMTSMITGAIASTVLFFLAPFLAEHTLSAAHLALELRITTCLLLLNALYGAQTGTLSGFEAFKTIAHLNLWRGVFTLPIAVATVLLWHLPGAVWGLVAAAAAGCALNHFAIRRVSAAAAVPLLYKGAWSERAVLWVFSVPAFICGVVVGSVGWVANTILVNHHNGYAEMGVFTAVYQWLLAISFVPIVLGRALLPILSSLWGSAEHKRMRRALAASALGCAAFAIPGAAIVIALSGRIMSWYGPAFIGRQRALVLTTLAAAVAAVQSPLTTLISSSGRMWLGAAANLGWAVVLLGATWALVRADWGADGLATAYLVAYCVHGTWAFWLAARILDSPTKLT